MEIKPDLFKKVKRTFIGNPRNLNDKNTFRQISLVVFLAWVGLGSDPLTSSCYGPEEIYRNLGSHVNLSIFVGLMTMITIFIISTSYKHIIKLFPHGGGGYLVASRLISPNVGMVSGCALLIDYVLTISISISSGADAIFSFLPIEFYPYKTTAALFAVGILILMNLRGVKESVTIIAPVFIIFLITHIALITYSLTVHVPQMQDLVIQTKSDFSRSVNELGIFGTLFLLMKAYSMGAGTYTGIEAVSNGIPNLREPKIKTAIKTMNLLAISLSVAVLGLIVSYFLFNVQVHEGRTLNAVLLNNVIQNWNPFIGKSFLYVTLISEAALLFAAAQTGFLDGPRVMANMAHDSWLPRRFSMLSDRLVSQNGILIMGIAAVVVIWLSKATVGLLVVLYSINVFITFSLSQFGMVKHWIQERKNDTKWFGKFTINGVGLMLTLFILTAVVFVKFKDGGWITILITGVLVIIVSFIKRHYNKVGDDFARIQEVMKSQIPELMKELHQKQKNTREEITNNDMTAVFFVNGYSGIGLYSLISTLNKFQNVYKNFVFVQIGIVDADSFHKQDMMNDITDTIKQDLSKYVYLIKQLGLKAEYLYEIGTEVADEIPKLIPEITAKYPNVIFIGGELVFSGTYRISKILHNYSLFAIQKKLYQMGQTMVVIPISFKKVVQMNKYF